MARRGIWDTNLRTTVWRNFWKGTLSIPTSQWLYCWVIGLHLWTLNIGKANIWSRMTKRWAVSVPFNSEGENIYCKKSVSLTDVTLHMSFCDPHSHDNYLTNVSLSSILWTPLCICFLSPLYARVKIKEIIINISFSEWNLWTLSNSRIFVGYLFFKLLFGISVMVLYTFLVKRSLY